MRSQPTLRYTITPGNLLWSATRVLSADVGSQAAGREPPDPVSRAVVSRGKPMLMVLVVGETARAANFSINGYSRPTTPGLAALDLVNFGRVTACGTSTEVSLPCLFSPFGRSEYDESRIRRHESLLHVLARTGVRVVWIDNQSGCKGVCTGLETVDVSARTDTRFCAGGRCHDEILLQALDEVAATIATDTIVVLHQIGNHGPAYSRRYPERFRHFAPACDSAQLRDCTREQIVNAYDNAIAYTDHVLVEVVRRLQAKQAEADVSMFYVSDHGESLGEHGLYLHGVPYAVAPREQTEVPMVWWMPEATATALGVDLRCLHARALQPASHDNVYPTLLALFDVNSPRYRPARDLLNGCRTAAAAVAAR